MSIRIVQSNQKRQNEDRWDWEVHLEGDNAKLGTSLAERAKAKKDNEELDGIEYVEYTLHETFPNPVRRSYNRNDGFQLKTSGWGIFTVYIRIHYKDEKRRDNLQELQLRFDQPSTSLRLQ